MPAEKPTYPLEVTVVVYWPWKFVDGGLLVDNLLLGCWITIIFSGAMLVFEDVLDFSCVCGWLADFCSSTLSFYLVRISCLFRVLRA